MILVKTGSYLVVFICCIFFNQAFTQGILPKEKKTLDSLESKWKSEKDEKVKESIQQKLNKHYDVITLRLKSTGEYDLAEKILKESMQCAKRGNDMNTYRLLHNNMGLLLKEMGRNQEAIDYYRKALKMNLKEENPITTAYLMNNLASMYYDDGQYEKAFEYMYKSAELRVKHNDPYAADAYWNISFAYQRMGDSLNYLKSLQKAGEMYKAMNDDYGNSSWHFTEGTIAYYNGDYEKSDKEYRLSAPLYQKLGYPEYVSWAYFGSARALKDLGKISEAMVYADSSYRLAHAIRSNERLKNAAKILTDLYLKTGDYKNAFRYYQRFIQVKDSIENLSNSKALIRSEAQIRYDRKFMTDSVTHAREEEISREKIARQETEIDLKRNQQILLFGGLGLVLLFAVFMYNRFRVTRRQKNIIEEQKVQVEVQRDLIEQQKHEVEEKNKEILDSINYAKRIQEAILPSRYSLVENLKNGFVLYKPKDIVAGDFYWLEKVDDIIYFAAADCTGHGVPGAMVSVVCSNALSKSLLEEKISDPGKILDRTRELVIERFSKSGENVKDGMDISLCKLNQNSGILFWSGANNPLWLIRNGELQELKPDKQPIGNYADPKPFTTHELKLEKGDVIYIFTDGYEDQFGGEKGKKFKAAKMKELFLSLQQLSMDDQKEKINEVFENWRGELEQVDDVCVIGVRIG